MSENIKCSLCNDSSEETVIFTGVYNKLSLNVCVTCLTESIMESIQESKKVAKILKKPSVIAELSFELIPISPNPKTEVYGYLCTKCKKPYFTNKEKGLHNCQNTTIADGTN